MKILLIFSLMLLVGNGNTETITDLQAVIEAVKASGAKWEAGNNFVKNTTLSTLKRLLGVKGLSNRTIYLKEIDPISDLKIPEKFDARDHWPYCESIRQIRNQGNCGSCWAVSSAAALTDRLCIATGGNFTLPLSSQEVLACCSECGEGCDGGYIFEAWRFFSYHGIVTGGEHNENVGCQPYEAGSITNNKGSLCVTCNSPETYKLMCEQECTNPSYPDPYKNDHHNNGQPYVLPIIMKEIQKEIMRYGPVQAAFTVYSDFMAYKSGIYYHVIGEVLGRHAVKIIGWGVENGIPYWLAANQWGKDWAEGGYFRIYRGLNECGIESDVVAGVPRL